MISGYIPSYSVLVLPFPHRLGSGSPPQILHWPVICMAYIGARDRDGVLPICPTLWTKCLLLQAQQHQPKAENM